ncbi:Gag-Pol protein [Plakobranchus ocellatus]|uniref:Gag-Pol protein n=1 Tax=Plakobranchus ocellatus TaxID=259542 RepID=A0AAV4AIT1_9GAST|nr:Gag-Pol protein [Plakobranchus ocellatus]
MNELKCSKIFSHFDTQHAFHQFEFSGESHYIATSAIHFGLRRYKRLMFSINAAPELFQDYLGQILHDIQCIASYIDDVIVYGKTRDEHDRNL